MINNKLIVFVFFTMIIITVISCDKKPYDIIESYRTF